MKKILLILLLIVTLVSCDSERGGKAVYSSVVILRKEQGTANYNGPWFSMYIYNGTNSKWYYTNQQTYGMYNVGDTINTLIFTDR